MNNATFTKTLSLFMLAALFVLPLSAKEKGTQAYNYYPATSDQTGYIGVSDDKPVDNPVDNIFHIPVEESLCGDEKVWLVYSLNGVQDYHGISRSINDQLATGGHLVKISQGWSEQREQIDARWLREGDNVIRFTLPEGAGHNYQVRNIRLEIERNDFEHADAALIVNASSSYYGNEAYIKGFVSGKEANGVSLSVAGQPVAVRNGEFEALVAKSTDEAQWTIDIEASFPDGTVLCEQVIKTRGESADYRYQLSTQVQKVEKAFGVSQSNTISLERTLLHAPKGALAAERQISITTLRDVDIPALDAGMTNVTAGAAAYRFLPHGTIFEQQVSLSLGYDESKIPEGYTAADVRTFYFDEQTHHWVPLKKDTLITAEGELHSFTNHFTDMINGVVKVPESPDVSAYNSNSMKGIEAANPTTAVNMMQVPQATQMGNAAINYPLNLPAGRNGIQPAIALSYSNTGANGWMGVGWDLSSPAVVVETRWGVPLYDENLESETYSLNGQMLSPVAHRAEFQPRSAEKRFYPRIEGAFQKIVRHGNSPDTYWWEVTDKSGARSFYGGDPVNGVNPNATLRDEFGNIARWCLVEMRDLNDNFLRYHYDLVEDSGLGAGGVLGVQLYCDQITYTGHGQEEGKYSVNFVRDRDLGESPRVDATISGMYGLKEVTADLLRFVEVKLEDEMIRSYEFSYSLGAFSKNLLTAITEYDADGEFFTSHTLEYYDDVNAAGGYLPFESEVSWTVGDDNVDGNFINPIDNFGDETSVLSGSKSVDVSVGMGVLVGFDPLPFLKTNSVGGNFGYAQSNSKGLTYMIDMDGDGLADKLFVSGNGLSYRPNLSVATGTPVFGERQAISGVGDFQTDKSQTVSGGVEAHGGFGPVTAFVGASRSKTTTVSRVYITEANGDQLPDIVVNGVVYFNHLNENGTPTFEANSGNTPNPINPEGAVVPGLAEPDLDEVEAAIDENPLHDVIRVWEAPHNGAIRITAPVQLLKETGFPLEVTDGVRVAIQHKGVELWSQRIDADDFSEHTPTGVDSIVVEEGDNIYFRLQSVFNGSRDSVRWAPNISYRSGVTQEIDPNDKRNTSYDIVKDFLLTADQAVGAPIDGRIKIEGTFLKQLTTDDIRIEIVKIDEDANETVVFEQFYDWFQGTTEAIETEVDVLKGEGIAFRILSTSNIDWPSLSWKPFVYYTASYEEGETALFNEAGEPLITFYPVPYMSMYNDKLKGGLPFIVPDTMSTVKVKPSLSLDNNIFTGLYSGELTLTIKKLDTLIAKDTLFIQNGSLVYDDTLSVTLTPGDEIFVELWSADSLLYQKFEDAEVKLGGQAVNTYVHAFRGDQRFGHMYRGWGQFAYNGNRDRADLPINESELYISEELKNAEKVDPESVSGEEFAGMDTYDPSVEKFIIMVPFGESRVWNGFDNYTYLNEYYMQSSRLGQDDILNPDSLGQDGSGSAGGGARAVDRVTVSTSNSFSAGGGIPGVSGAYGLTFGDTYLKQDFVDMNGDRYPDIVTPDIVQYTDHLGALTNRAINHGNGDNSHTKTESESVSLSGSFAPSIVKPSAGNARKVKVSLSGGSVSAGLSGNFGKGTNDIQSTWMDINGDGLPDRVYQNGTAALNLGYRFAPAEPWGFGNISAGRSKNYGAGLGISIVNGSISAGVSLNRSDNFVTHSLQDVNGDGLLDEVMEGNPVRVKFNTGSGFSAPVEWTGANSISNSSSTGESANVAFTAGIYIPLINIKIIVNPSVSVGQGVSRDLTRITDVDGDGYPDFVRSDKDDDLHVSRSTIGRTDMLKTVTRPLGATFTLDYTPMGSTYEMPNTVWVLSEVTSFDGFAGDGVDHMKTTIEYEGGIHERKERQFYGFSRIINNSHDTSDDDKIYRRTIQDFINDNYYEKGLMVSEVLEDGDGNLFTEVINEYVLTDIFTGEELPDNFRTSLDGTAYPAMTKTVKHYYEGEEQAGKSTEVQYAYDLYGNVTRYIDLGDAGEEDDLISDITYFDFPQTYLVGTAKAVTIKGTDRTYRKRDSEIDASTGNITRIYKELESGEQAVHDMTYDAYGNIISITRPENLHGERFTISYEFDDVVHTYPAVASDSYGYESSTEYDFRFGLATRTTDLNGNVITYELDAAGRFASVTGPYERNGGAPFTIGFEYFQNAEVPYALTKHYDPQHPQNFMETVIFVDGIGRVIQSKKDAAIFDGAGKDDVEQMIVSGRTTFDAFGRAVEQYYPVLEDVGNQGVFNPVYDDIAPTTSTYDVLDRELTKTEPDNSVTTKEYGFASDYFNTSQFHTKITDANGNTVEKYADIRGNITSVNHAGEVWTAFTYNALKERLSSIDHDGNVTTHTYDWFGRKVKYDHPDKGITTYAFDLTGNVTEMVTANLAAKGLAITYDYDLERLTDIIYPEYTENNVHYEYGAPNAGDNQVGRVVLQEDATGGQEFFYGPFGETTKTVRTIVIPRHDEQTYTTEYKYDTWNRLEEMTYPDGEVVTFNYNLGGQLNSMVGKKQRYSFDYVEQLSYDKFEQRVYLAYGNGTNTSFTYEPDRRRLATITAVTAKGRAFIDNAYTYDAVNNITKLKNNAPVPSPNLMGGASEYNYEYDNLYRLTKATGYHQGSNQEHRYEMQMSYGPTGTLLNKSQLHERKSSGGGSWKAQNKTTYTLQYEYQSDAPHAPSKIGDHTYTYDANGNTTGWDDDLSGQRRNIIWDEEDRIRAIYENGAIYHYVYDANGERVLKSQSSGQTVFKNSDRETGSGNVGNYTVYVNPYVVLRSGSYTKHYFIESQRIVSKIGGGMNDPSKGKKAGHQKINYLEKQEDLKFGIVKNLKFLGVDGAILTAGKSGKVPPGQINGTGPGNNNSKESEPFQYYFHPDHLGSTSYITDASGEVYQHLEYFAFGETFVEEHSNTHRTPYLFSGKELDEETGLYYFGARYYDPKISMWLGVDPKADEFPSWSPYQYCNNNPIILTDPDGQSPISIFAKMAAKQGLKQAAKMAVKSAIKSRLKAYMSKKWATQLLDDALTAIDVASGQSWWEYAIEVIPVVGDAYGGYKLTEQGYKVWKLVERIEKRVDAVAKTVAKRGALRKAMGLTDATKEAHHLIPVKLLKENDVVQDAVAAGFQFNGKRNGLAVAKGHGSHPSYTKALEKKINDWKDANPDYTPEQAKAFLEKLADKAKTAITNNGGVVNTTTGF